MPVGILVNSLPFTVQLEFQADSAGGIGGGLAVVLSCNAPDTKAVSGRANFPGSLAIEVALLCRLAVDAQGIA